MIKFIGDVHGNFEKLNNYLYNLKEKEPYLEAIIQVGDFGWFPSFDNIYNNFKYLKNLKVPVYFCDGNHEDMISLKSYNNNTLYGKEKVKLMNNLYWMPRGSVLKINNKNILFAGGGAFNS